MKATHDAQEDVAEFYDEEAASYDDRFESAAGKYIHQRQVSIILEQLEDIDGKKILEIAAGTGRFTRVLAEQGADVYVVDISRSMLKENQSSTSNVDYIQGTASDLPFEDRSFDMCITINALNHIPGHWKVIEDVNRVLKRGGTFLANYPNLLSNRLPVALYVNQRNKNIGKGVYTKWFNVFEVKSRLIDLGYEIQKCIGDRLLPVKFLPSIMIPLVRRTEGFVDSTPLANVCVSPFIKAKKL